MKRPKRGWRRAGQCITHHDLAWIYDDGSVGCMYAYVVEIGSSECEWAPMPPVWLQQGQDAQIKTPRAH